MEHGGIEMKSGAREVIIEATGQGSRNLAYSRKPRLEVYRRGIHFYRGGVSLTVLNA